jgi:two-component sensor histidine kinase
LGLVSLGVLAVGAGAAFFYSRTIARELASLEYDAQSLGRGDVVAPRSGRISNFERLQATLAEASRDLAVQADRQRLMINELNHRVKNALATVQSLAVQTFRGADPETARAKFDTRLTALAAGHDLITQKNWEQVELAEIVGRCGAQPDQITAEGPGVTLQPQAALAMCMCLHELTTNSLKYGALSTPAGRVVIVWTVCPDARSIEFVWQEEGGPRVQPPAEGGFGTRLIDRLARHELAGVAEREFAPDGLICTIRMGLTTASRWRNDFDA